MVILVSSIFLCFKIFGYNCLKNWLILQFSLQSLELGFILVLKLVYQINQKLLMTTKLMLKLKIPRILNHLNWLEFIFLRLIQKTTFAPRIIASKGFLAQITDIIILRKIKTLLELKPIFALQMKYLLAIKQDSSKNIRCNLNAKNINESIDKLLSKFNKKRLDSLAKINLKDLIKRKNPYLFQAKNIQTGEQFIREIIDATISSSEQAIFGNLIETFAIEICNVVFGGKKAKEGIFASVDLIFEDEKNLYLIGIKSEPSWGNSDSVKKIKIKSSK